MNKSTNPSDTHICIRCHIAGIVQGVFFRASTRSEAQRLGVTGYARNLPDGRVEVLACGPADAVGALRAWLHLGPSRAQVTEVACEPVPLQPIKDFTAS